MKRWLSAVAAFAILAMVGGSAIRPDHSAPASNIPTNLGRLPLAFEPNVGQADGSVKFLSHSGGTTLTLTSTEALLSLPGARSSTRPAGRLTERAPSDVLGLAFTGSHRPRWWGPIAFPA